MGAEFSSQCDIRIAIAECAFCVEFRSPRSRARYRRRQLAAAAADRHAARVAAAVHRRISHRRRGAAIGYVDQVVPSEELLGTALASRAHNRRRLAILAEAHQGDGLRGARRGGRASTCSATPRRWRSVSNPTITKRGSPRSSSGARHGSPALEETNDDDDHFGRHGSRGDGAARGRRPVAHAAHFEVDHRLRAETGGILPRRVCIPIPPARAAKSRRGSRRAARSISRSSPR